MAVFLIEDVVLRALVAEVQHFEHASFFNDHSPVRLASVFGAVMASIVALFPIPACDFQHAELIVTLSN